MAGSLNGGAPKYDAPYYSQNERSKRRRWCLVLTGLVVLVVLICAIAIPVSMKKGNKDDEDDVGNSDRSRSPDALERACNQTRFYDVCIESLRSMPNADSSNPQAFVKLAVLAASKGVSEELSKAQQLLEEAAEDPNLSAVASDCVDNLIESLDEINQTLDRLNEWDLLKLKEQLGDLQTWMSSALTLQQTCHDDFEDLNVTGPAADIFLSNGTHTEKLLSNALALVNTLRTLTSDLIGRRLLSDGATTSEDPNEVWVRPLRKLLQSTETITPNAVVATDGTGDFTSIEKAVRSAPQKSDERFVILIKAGVYEENVEVPKNYWNIMFIGEGENRTLITASKSVVGDGITTSKTGTLTVMGKGFIGRDFTVENTAGAINHQAVALRVAGDLSAFSRCTFLGYQDTLYTHTNRQFYRNCTVVGTVDFIFGNAAAVLQSCTILASVGLPGQQNTYTAQGRTDPNQNTGLSFQRCTVSSTANLTAKADEYKTYLGRPWKPYSVTIFMQSTLGSIIDPEGWLLWNGETQNLDTIYYAEYMNVGPGAGVSKRLSWTYQITNANDARKFTPDNFIAASTWLPATAIEYSGSL